MRPPWLAKAAPKNGRARRNGCPRCRHAGAKERFGNQNRQKLAWPDDFLKSQAAKFAPGCGERAVWKSNSLKDGMMGAVLEGQVGKICTMLWRESGWEVKIVKDWRRRSTFYMSPAKFGLGCGKRAVWK